MSKDFIFDIPPERKAELNLQRKMELCYLACEAINPDVVAVANGLGGLVEAAREVARFDVTATQASHNMHRLRNALKATLPKEPSP